MEAMINALDLHLFLAGLKTSTWKVYDRSVFKGDVEMTKKVPQACSFDTLIV